MSCSVCGVREGVRRLAVSDNFVSFPDLFVGGHVCGVCAALFEDRRLRASNWLLVGDEFRLLGREELLGALRDPPVNSLIYVKSSGRRYGFLRCMRLRSSKSAAVVCGEDEGPITVPRERLARVLDDAVAAYRVLKRKSALVNGCSPIEWVHEDACRAVEEHRGDPVWAVVVRAL